MKLNRQIQCKFLYLVELRLVSLKRLPENTCISGRVFHRHEGLGYASTKTPNFPLSESFSALFDHSENLKLIITVLVVSKYHSWPTLPSFGNGPIVKG